MEHYPNKIMANELSHTKPKWSDSDLKRTFEVGYNYGYFEAGQVDWDREEPPRKPKFVSFKQWKSNLIKLRKIQNAKHTGT
jgi:hypothetical protein